MGSTAESSSFQSERIGPPSNKPPTTSPRNQLEIQFFGLQRSGNHAVLSWIFHQFDVPVYFFNNVKHFADPFLNFRYASLPNTIPVRRGPGGDDPSSRAARARVHARLEKIRATDKHLFAYSYENFPLARLHSCELVGERLKTIGSSDKIRRVLLVRDFYNWIASRIRLLENKNKNVPPEAGIDRLISLWLTYAKEYVGETNFMREETLVRISYNRWVMDEFYRIGLLGELGVPLKENVIDYVPDVGGGSSFDGDALGRDKETRNRSLIGRWRYLLEDRFGELIRPIRCRREQIQRYNRDIFGLDWPL